MTSASQAGTIRVLAFAAVRDLLGASQIQVALAAPCTADELWPVLIERFPALAGHRRSVRLAVNGTYAFASDPVQPGDEVALIPPVAGG